MAEQQRSGTQRKSSARKSAASKSGAGSKSAPKRGTTKATSKASRGGAQSKRGSSGSGGRSAAAGNSSRRKASGSGGPGSGSAGGSNSGGSAGRGDGRRSSPRNGTSGREAVLQAREQVAELMGRPVESVLGMERDDDGWLITVQMVELARIPNSTDVLADYAVRVDDSGEVIGYRRTRRYHRSQADDG